RASLPERPEVVRERLVREHGLSEETARQIQRSGELDRFVELVGLGHGAPLVARVLIQEFAALGNALPEWDSDRLAVETLHALLGSVERGEFSKEGILNVLTEFAKGAATLDQAKARVGLSALPIEELRRFAREVVEKNRAMVRERGAEAFQPLMGDLMKLVRGRTDGRAVAEALREALGRASDPKGP
ncbi:MAG TPA: hypothetical protein VGS23_07425, partial [Thermoplasmata archaeon]|nr:hypothetical protein [Thermoplasmata archaeon]